MYVLAHRIQVEASNASLGKLVELCLDYHHLRSAYLRMIFNSLIARQGTHTAS
jgi:hypothetical protein